MTYEIPCSFGEAKLGFPQNPNSRLTSQTGESCLSSSSNSEATGDVGTGRSFKRQPGLKQSGGKFKGFRGWEDFKT